VSAEVIWQQRRMTVNSFARCQECATIKKHYDKTITVKATGAVETPEFSWWLFSALQIVFLFFLQENNLRKALIPFIGVRRGTLG
jgi:hypothetical protein